MDPSRLLRLKGNRPSRGPEDSPSGELASPDGLAGPSEGAFARHPSPDRPTRYPTTRGRRSAGRSSATARPGRRREPVVLQVLTELELPRELGACRPDGRHPPAADSGFDRHAYRHAPPATAGRASKPSAGGRLVEASLATPSLRRRSMFATSPWSTSFVSRNASRISLREDRRRESQAHREHVGVVPSTRATCRLGVGAQRGADPVDLVRGDRAAGARPAEQDTSLRRTRRDTRARPLPRPPPTASLSSVSGPYSSTSMPRSRSESDTASVVSLRSSEPTAILTVRTLAASAGTAKTTPISVAIAKNDGNRSPVFAYSDVRTCTSTSAVNRRW